MQSSICVFVLSLHVATSVFFHELSSFDLEANVHKTNSAFGFSLGYQEGKAPKILIGSPRYDLTGRVFQCLLEDIKTIAAGAAKTVKCQPITIDLDAMHVEYSRNQSQNQEFYLGASIAATEKYFVTCAPLRTAFLADGGYYGAYGICFYCDDEGTAKPWRGPGREKYLEDHNSTTFKRAIEFSGDIYGGCGWTTMVDKVHDRIIIAKSFYPTDAFYGRISQPESTYESFVEHNIMPKTDFRASYGQAMTFGNYFDLNKDNTHYAISLTLLTAQGYIQLIESKTMKMVVKNLGDHNVGSMFGAALSSADVTGDARAELLVGAPAHAEGDASWDRGALHIYTAGPDQRSMDLVFTILGARDGARFGTTLAANDVDGDSHPEILVSAPFENAGKGALYVLCGYEIQKESLKRGKASSISVSSLKRTQTIYKETYETFGFSLLPISDFNDNGSDELLVGSPGNSKVTLYMGIRAITVTVTSRISSTPVDNENEYVFSSCVAVRKPLKPSNITTKLLIKNVLNGNDAVFKSAGDTNYQVDLATAGTPVAAGTVEYCTDLTIMSTTPCEVTTKVGLVEDVWTKKEFSNTWVTLSGQSELEKTTRLTCFCANQLDCAPDLSLQLRWSGNETGYEVGVSRSELVAIVVHNDGTNACYSCILVRVRGAPVDHFRCEYKKPTDEYECFLPSPFRGNTDNTIDLKLLMDISNQDKQLQVEVKLRKNCDEAAEITQLLTVPYKFHADLVTVKGSSVNYSISDIELQDESQHTLTEEQIYTIINNRSVNWKNVSAIVAVDKKPYIQSIRVSVASKLVAKCVDSNDDDKFTSQCSLNLPSNSSVEITVLITTVKKEITKYLQDWQITITSELTLELSSDITKHHKLSTVIMFQKEQTIGQNKTLIIIIAVVVGLVVLLIIVLILYKVGFFKRKTKEQLQDLKQEIRKRSIRRDRLASQKSQNQHEHFHCDTDDLVIIEESPFDESSPVETTASAHAPGEKKTS